MKNKLLLKMIVPLCFLLINGMKVYSQGNNAGITVKMNGYVANLGGRVFFQPCEDSSFSIWQCLNNTSFPLWYFREDLYLEAIEGLGDSVKVYCYDNDDKQKYYMNLSYFYCSVEVDMMFLDTTQFEVFQKPKYEVLYDNKKFYLFGFRVENRVKKILPKNKEDACLMYNYYASRNYRIPDWLDELFPKKKKKRRTTK